MYSKYDLRFQVVKYALYLCSEKMNYTANRQIGDDLIEEYIDTIFNREFTLEDQKRFSFIDKPYDSEYINYVNGVKLAIQETLKACISYLLNHTELINNKDFYEGSLMFDIVATFITEALVDRHFF